MNKSEKFWDKQASSFDPEGDGQDPTFVTAVAITKKYLRESDVVLDYGCATGALTFAIADLVQTVEGIDISSKMIALAQRNADAQQIANTRFTQATIFNTLHQDGSFDLVLAFNILHLLENAQSAMQKIHQLLKPEGLFISTTPCLGEKRAVFSAFLSLMSKTGMFPRITKFKSTELKNLISSAGFQIEETEILSSDYSETFIVARQI